MTKNPKNRRGRRMLGAFLAVASLQCFALSAVADQPGVQPIADPAFYVPPADLSGYQRGDLIKFEKENGMQPGIFAMIDTYRIMYLSKGAKGDPVAETGYVFVHKTAPTPEGGWNIVAWAHGTSGVGDDCAPSKYDDLWPEWPWLDYGKVAADLVYAGFVSVAPDYEGMGTPGVASYLNSPAMGNSVIDSVKAARQLLSQLNTVDRPLSTSGEWAVIGHSQGGYAARAANVLATYANAPDLTFRGSVEMASSIAGYDDAIQALKDTAGLPVPGFPIIGYVAASIRAVNPDFDYSKLVGPVMLEHMSEAETDCGDTWNETVWGSVPQPALYDIINPDYASDPDVQNAARALAFGSDGVGSQGPGADDDRRPGRVHPSQPAAGRQGLPVRKRRYRRELHPLSRAEPRSAAEERCVRCDLLADRPLQRRSGHRRVPVA